MTVKNYSIHGFVFGVFFLKNILVQTNKKPTNILGVSPSFVSLADMGKFCLRETPVPFSTVQYMLGQTVGM